MFVVSVKVALPNRICFIRIISNWNVTSMNNFDSALTLVTDLKKAFLCRKKTTQCQVCSLPDYFCTYYLWILEKRARSFLITFVNTGINFLFLLEKKKKKKKKLLLWKKQFPLESQRKSTTKIIYIFLYITFICLSIDNLFIFVLLPEERWGLSFRKKKN